MFFTYVFVIILIKKFSMATRNKIAVIFAVIFFASMTMYSAWDDLNADRSQFVNAVLVEKQLQEIILLNDVITELQKERGLSAIYQADPNEKFAAAVAQQRLQTDRVLAESTVKLDLSALIAKRTLILQNGGDTQAGQAPMFGEYTRLISQLMQKCEDLVFHTHNTELKNSLITYHLLKSAQEAVAQLRSKVGTVLASKSLTDRDYREIVVLNAVYHLQIEKSRTHLSSEVQALLTNMEEQACTRQTFSLIQKIITKSQNDFAPLPMDWFKLSTCTVEHIRDVADRSLEQIRINAAEMTKQAKNAMIKHLFFWGGGVLTLSLLLFISFKRSSALSREQQLRKNYQEAIDYSTIVSKADKKGIITYVNRAFCDISGYSAKELLHQPHRIVRHPDMPKEVFRALWSDLKEGKRWQGIIKNLRKDGTPYWVDASISPIFDDKGRLVEYIAIRRDVTEMVLLNEEIKETQRELIYRMGEAVESRSKESGHHIQRVAHYSRLLAQVCGLSNEECEIIFVASTMHDIGKISIPDAILLKPGALNKEEWSTMKTHAEVGYKILQGSERPLLKMAATVAYEHHEHFDGNGYPRGIKGHDISIYGRIVAIADVFDALATDRIYKKAWPLDEIVTYLKTQSGKQFDPELIELFVNYLDQFIEIKNRFKDTHAESGAA